MLHQPYSPPQRWAACMHFAVARSKPELLHGWFRAPISRSKACNRVLLYHETMPCPLGLPSQFGDALLTLLEKFLERDAGVPAALLCCACNACEQQGVGVAWSARRWRRLWGCGASAPLCPGVERWVGGWVRLLCVCACCSQPQLMTAGELRLLGLCFR